MRNLCPDILMLLAVFAGPPAFAQEAPLSWGTTRAVPSAEADAVQRQVAEQMAALRASDGALAYAAAAPNVRRKFPTEARFMAMVRDAYAPLLSSTGSQFGPVRGAAGTPTRGPTFSENVDFTADGHPWTAVFGLEREDDGALTITSCVLIARPEPGA